MIPYNQKNPFVLVFKFHKADTFRKLFPFVILYALYCWGVAHIGLDFKRINEKNPITNIDIMHTLLGFVISTLLAFRTNSAYDRWWEGRKLWGTLVNNTRNFAMKLDAMLPDNAKEIRDFFKQTLIAYPLALHYHLREENTRTELFSENNQIFVDIDTEKHVPNQLGKLMYKKVHEMFTSKIITGEQLIFLTNELQTYADVCGACERIKNTPIPYAYSVFIKKFIFIYVITLPFGYVYNLGYWVIAVASFIFYVLVSLELIAEEIEDPFGGDQNDVPTDLIAKNIAKNIEDIM